MSKFHININPDILKIIGLISMTIDHLVKAANIPNAMVISNSIGRLAFPIFGFLLALNLARFKTYHISTKSIYKKYFIRLLSFGFIAFYLDYLTAGYMQYNILFTFALSVLFIYIENLTTTQNFSQIQKILFISITLLWLTRISFAVEYGPFGFFYIILFYYFLLYRTNYFLVPLILVSLFVNGDMIAITITLITTITLIFSSKIHHSQHKRIITKWWIFYLYYPLHKTIIHLIF